MGGHRGHGEDRRTGEEAGLAAVSALGVPFIVRELVVRDGWMVAFGLAVQVGAEVWSIERMALRYDEVAAAGRAPGSGD